MSHMSQKAVDYIASVVKIGLCVLPVLTLIVAGNFFASIFLLGIGDLFFPFITGKNFFFRMVVEILFALWVFAAVFSAKGLARASASGGDRWYLPRTSPIFWMVLATVGILTLSTIFGVNPYRSFWSNYERMDGLVSHLHLFAYFVMLISVFKTETDWRRFFYSTIFVSFIITVYAYLQFLGRLEIHQSSDRLDATLGNATYLAIYMIFHLALLAYWLFKEKRVLVKSVFTALFVLEAPIVFLTATRGAILGLLGGAMLFALFIAMRNWGVQNMRHKLIAAGVMGAVFLMVGSFFAFKNTDFVQKNYVLSRFAQLSPEERTTKSRITIWGMALEGFKERPILGWGPENFNIVFNKYFKAELWQQEPWFDRAHNVVFDWLIHGGIFGLFAYFGAFLFGVYALWRKQADYLAKAVFTSLFAAYFFHNFFVFDNLVSYLMFFAVLGFIHFLSGQTLGCPTSDGRRTSLQLSNPIAKYALAIFVSVAMIFSLYFVNIKPLMAGRALLTTLKDMSAQGQNTDLILADFDKVFSYNTFGNMEAREQFASYATSVAASGLPAEVKVKVLGKAIAQMEMQVTESPLDAREHLFLASLYLRGGRIDDALKVLSRAQELSPQKQQIAFLLADAYITKGDNAKAFEVLKNAYELDTSYAEAAKNLALGAVLLGNKKYADELLTKALGSNLIADQNLLTAYARAGDFKKVRDIWLLFLEKEPANAQYHVNLAATYMQLGERQNAIRELQKAIELNPQFKAQGERFIEEIRAGRNP